MLCVAVPSFAPVSVWRFLPFPLVRGPLLLACGRESGFHLGVCLLGLPAFVCTATPTDSLCNMLVAATHYLEKTDLNASFGTWRHTPQSSKPCGRCRVVTRGSNTVYTGGRQRTERRAHTNDLPLKRLDLMILEQYSVSEIAHQLTVDLCPVEKHLQAGLSAMYGLWRTSIPTDRPLLDKMSLKCRGWIVHVCKRHVVSNACSCCGCCPQTLVFTY